MTLHLWLTDLFNYSVQVAAVIAAGSLAPWLLRLRRPDAMLVYRQLLLAACLLLPLLQPWRHPAIASSVDVSLGVATLAGAVAPVRHWPTLEQSTMFLLCAGVLLRLCWLAIGLSRLRRHRQAAERATRLPAVCDDMQSGLRARPWIGFSAELPGPVTFGIRNPVILLPAKFLDMPAGAQQAIACHEITHIRRGDWAFTLAEEVVRAALWFHPAVWWLLGQIQLTREQAVDREVIEITASREQYIDALLAVAEGRPHLDLAPAPLFLQKSHLSRRVALILKGASMSKQRLLSSLAAVCGALLVTARLAMFYFPISAPAQEIVRGETSLLHRAPLEYPLDAIAKGVQGTVVVAATLNERGVVVDARVVSGPEPLRKAALKSVLEWHYSGQAQSPVEVAIDFKLPAKQSAASGTVPGGSPAIPSGRVSRVQMTGVSSQLREALDGRIPVRVGDEVQADSLPRVKQAVRDVDEHLDARLTPMAPAGGGQEFALTVVPTAPMVTPVPAGNVQRIRVGGNIQATQVLSNPRPAYPPLAKQARLQGKTRFNLIIGKDGTVQDIQLDFGHPLLAEAAMDAVRQWVYKPTLLNGETVEVATVVDVNFTLKE